MTNHRELFERLAKCNLPAGVKVLVHSDAVEVITPEGSCFYTPRDKSGCRAALMLIVDELESTGEWRFSRHRDSKGVVKCALTRCSILRPVPFTSSRADQVTALAECLIAALGVKE